MLDFSFSQYFSKGVLSYLLLSWLLLFSFLFFVFRKAFTARKSHHHHQTLPESR